MLSLINHVHCGIVVWIPPSMLCFIVVFLLLASQSPDASSCMILVKSFQSLVTLASLLSTVIALCFLIGQDVMFTLRGSVLLCCWVPPGVFKLSSFSCWSTALSIGTLALSVGTLTLLISVHRRLGDSIWNSTIMLRTRATHRRCIALLILGGLLILFPKLTISGIINTWLLVSDRFMILTSTVVLDGAKSYVVLRHWNSTLVSCILSWSCVPRCGVLVRMLVSIMLVRFLLSWCCSVIRGHLLFVMGITFRGLRLLLLSLFS